MGLAVIAEGGIYGVCDVDAELLKRRAMHFSLPNYSYYKPNTNFYNFAFQSVCLTDKKRKKIY